jgi:hypothetical protein
LSEDNFDRTSTTVSRPLLKRLLTKTIPKGEERNKLIDSLRLVTESVDQEIEQTEEEIELTVEKREWEDEDFIRNFNDKIELLEKLSRDHLLGYKFRDFVKKEMKLDGILETNLTDTEMKISDESIARFIDIENPIKIEQTMIDMINSGDLEAMNNELGRGQYARLVISMKKREFNHYKEVQKLSKNLAWVLNNIQPTEQNTVTLNYYIADNARKQIYITKMIHIEEWRKTKLEEEIDTFGGWIDAAKSDVSSAVRVINESRNIDDRLEAVSLIIRISNDLVYNQGSIVREREKNIAVRTYMEVNDQLTKIKKESILSQQRFGSLIEQYTEAQDELTWMTKEEVKKNKTNEQIVSDIELLIDKFLSTEAKVRNKFVAVDSPSVINELVKYLD